MRNVRPMKIFVLAIAALAASVVLLAVAGREVKVLQDYEVVANARN